MLYRAGVIAALIAALISPVIGATPARAQEAPPAVTAALAALNAQLGANLTLDDLDSWQWTQRNFPDRSLDCPVEGYTYPQFSTNGTIVLLVYNGIQYDFRVYSGSLQVFQCTPNSGAPGGTPGDSSATATPDTPALTPAPGTDTAAPTAPPTNTPGVSVTAGEIACAGGLPVRLAVGMRARNIASGSINIRQPADLDDPDAVKGLLLPGAEFDVIGGPQCADNRTWWEVRYQSAVGETVGWVIEGDNAEYWLEPVDATAAPPPDSAPPPPAPGTDTREPITPANAAQLRLFSRIPVQDEIAQVVFMPAPSPDALLIDTAGTLHYYAGDTVARVDVNLNHPNLQVMRAASGEINGFPSRIATLEINTDAPDGVVLYVSEISNLGAVTVTEQFGFQLPHLPNALAFSLDGRLLAAGSGEIPEYTAPGLPNLVWLWNAETGQQLPTIQLDGPAADLAISPDNAYIAITQPGTGVQVWAVDTNQPVTTLFNAPGFYGTPSLVWSPDGMTLAVGTTDGRVILYDMRDPASAAPQRVLTPFTDAEVHFVAFNATGSLLATGGVTLVESDVQAAQSAGVMVWDVATGTQLVTLATDSAEPLTGLAFRDGGQQLIATGRVNWWTWGVF